MHQIKTTQVGDLLKYVGNLNKIESTGS